jgi:uncharacterized protein
MSMSEPFSPTLIKTCNGRMLKRLMMAGLAWLDHNRETVNKLNVFPVPDGDTGTNMVLTMHAAYQSIEGEESSHVGVVSHKLAQGALMGSRGNSGTILSQLLVGFARIVQGHEEFDAAMLAAAAREAVALAYKAVGDPTEGTILTVAREVMEGLQVDVTETEDLRVILEHAVANAQASVARTPDLLPKLKQSGVVDSGGQGLAYILEGMLRLAQGENLTVRDVAVGTAADLAEVLKAEDARGYGYDVQFLLRGHDLNIEAIRADIGAMGDSMVVVGDSSTVKVHIHVHDPGVPLSYGVKLGAIVDIVVENMQAQSEDYIAMRTEADAEPEIEPITGDIAVVTVSPGEGLSRIFREHGAAAVISGGQTMNPSTEELLTAIRSVQAHKVILLPNNKNIILAAELASVLAVEKASKQVKVIPTTTVPQGIAAILSFNPFGDVEDVITAMDTARNGVITGEVTTATRTVQLEVSVTDGQIIGLADGKLVVAGDDLTAVVLDLLKHMVTAEHEIITLYYGANVTAEDARALVDTLQEHYPDQEFDVIFGGQPHYHYILSAE